MKVIFDNHFCVYLNNFLNLKCFAMKLFAVYVFPGLKISFCSIEM